MGFIHLLDMSGNHLRTYRPHSASVLDLTVDDDNFVASASMDGELTFEMRTHSLQLTVNVSKAR